MNEKKTRNRETALRERSTMEARRMAAETTLHESLGCHFNALVVVVAQAVCVCATWLPSLCNIPGGSAAGRGRRSLRSRARGFFSFPSPGQRWVFRASTGAARAAPGGGAQKRRPRPASAHLLKKGKARARGTGSEREARRPRGRHAEAAASGSGSNQRLRRNCASAHRGGVFFVTTRVLPMACAATSMISMPIRMLFQPPWSYWNATYAEWWPPWCGVMGDS